MNSAVCDGGAEEGSGEVKAVDQPVVMAGTRAVAEAGNLNKSTNQDFL
jgi:hypothetical protein